MTKCGVQQNHWWLWEAQKVVTLWYQLTFRVRVGVYNSNSVSIKQLGAPIIRASRL
ncbi:MAG: hypothetical protein QW688_08810 [Thermoprotei archaeon]